MTVKDYATLMGVSKTAVFKKYKAGKKIPGVKSWSLEFGQYILTVDVEAAKATKTFLKKNLVGNRKPLKLAV